MKHEIKQTPLTRSKPTGFSLIELILYIALISIFMTGAVLFGWDIVYAGKKAEVQREVNQNIRLASKRIVYEVRNAAGINSSAANSLCLSSSNPTYNPTRLYLSSGVLRIAWGGGSTNCTGMTNDQPLTSNNVQVTSLVFSNRTSGPESENIEYTLTIGSSGVRQEWQHSQSITGTVEIRSN